MRIKIDVDNVIRDMSQAMLDVYNGVYGPGGLGNHPMTKEDITDYDVTKSFPLAPYFSIDARTYFFDQHKESLYRYARPMTEAIRGIRKLKEKGNEIIIVSYQPTQAAKEMTIEWLSKHEVPYDAIVFTNTEDKTIISADYIIDDNPKFLDADPAKKVCIDWAYNRGRNYDYRVESIYEFYRYLYGETFSFYDVKTAEEVTKKGKEALKKMMEDEKINIG